MTSTARKTASKKTKRKSQELRITVLKRQHLLFVLQKEQDLKEKIKKTKRLLKQETQRNQLLPEQATINLTDSEIRDEETKLLELRRVCGEDIKINSNQMSC